ncbi:hypothetical protein HDU91_003319 [Kappamyces sp. JEL0680]|nr:hypothetical protein HDU91_003319 [Kappamyces sp. JEL0680]
MVWSFLISVPTLVAAGSSGNASPQVTLQVSPSVVAGGFVQVAWSGAPSSSNDWVLFSSDGAVPSALKKNYIEGSWQYTYRDTEKTGGASTPSGSVSVKAPAEPGTYVIYYCQDNGYTCLGGTQITVTAPAPVCVSKPNSKIEHVVLVVSENHSFDAYYGRYCQAPFGSNPDCNEGRNCCEAIQQIPGHSPILLTDQANVDHDPWHLSGGEGCEINGGAMDKYIEGCSSFASVIKYSDPRNYAAADGTNGSAAQYWKWAAENAMSDRFFQSSIGASSQNDMYFARGAFVFKDNSIVPPTEHCPIPIYNTVGSYKDPTIADLLLGCKVSMNVYQEGYTKSKSFGSCFPSGYTEFKKTWDPSDIGFQYFDSMQQQTNFFKDHLDFFTDVKQGQLPAFSFIKPGYYNCEHPGQSTISSGEAFNGQLIDTILSHPTYANNTLILLTADESGGFRDSVRPPPRSPIDNKEYGPRTQFLAIGHFAKKNYISHVQMEPSSIVRFLESNFLGGKPGQLQTRDAQVNNIGSLLDPLKTGFDFI